MQNCLGINTKLQVAREIRRTTLLTLIVFLCLPFDFNPYISMNFPLLAHKIFVSSEEWMHRYVTQIA